MDYGQTKSRPQTQTGAATSYIREYAVILRVIRVIHVICFFFGLLGLQGYSAYLGLVKVMRHIRVISLFYIDLCICLYACRYDGWQMVTADSHVQFVSRCV